MVVMVEEWRPIPSFPGYEASSLGRIRSLDRTKTNRNGVVRKYTGRVLRPHIGNKGYARVRPNNVDPTGIAPLVCEAFHGLKPSPLHEVAHNDGTKDNDVPGNLRWATHAENMDDKIKHRTICRGATHGRSKFTEASVLQVLDLRKAGLGWRTIGKMMGVSHTAVRDVCRGKNWAHVTLPLSP